MGGWFAKIDGGAPGPNFPINKNNINAATVLYDPVSDNDLSFANAGYHNAQCGTDVPGNPGGHNTAGATNGSHSEWEVKCVSFTASSVKHRIHFYAVTDFNLCTTCHHSSGAKHGSYMGISKVVLSNNAC
tara:strand:- start:618 stop:1007 length:390 start_codon:yes stop_codon:yes gene_type:complete